MNLIRPLRFSLPLVLPFIFWLWVSTAGIDYDGGDAFRSLRTAGWFTLGFPATLGFAYLFAWLVAALYRRFGATAVCLIWLLLAGSIALTIKGSLPQGRVAKIIGNEAAKDIVVYRLISRDSFGDGRYTIGEISGSAELLASIAEARSLQEFEIVLDTQFSPFLLDTGDYTAHPAFGDSRSTFYFSPETNRIYFRHRGG